MKFLPVALLLSTALAAPYAPAQPAGWTPVTISEQKRPTVYSDAVDDGRPVLHAVAEGSASALGRHADFDLLQRPLLSWRWKVSRLVASADNTVGRREDAPARVVLVFEGDIDKLPAHERHMIQLAQTLSGHKLPYATLMYIWGNKAAVDSVIPNPHTDRLQMIVASAGESGVGQWQVLSRDVVADFQRAFGEMPGRLHAYGVMSDTDNTGEAVEAWYGDIEFRPRLP